MTDPVSAVAIGGIGMSMLGGVTSAIGTAQSSNAQVEQLKYRAGLANINAQIEEQNANYAILQGEQTAAKYGIAAREKAGAIRAAQSASNLDVNSGSAKNVQDSQQTISQIDLDQIRQNAQRTAFGYRTQAAAARGQAGLDTLAAKQVRQAEPMAIASSLLSSGSSVASKWLQGNQQGLWGNNQALGA